MTGDEHLRQKNGVNAGGASENKTRSMRGPGGARRYQERDGVLEIGGGGRGWSEFEKYADSKSMESAIFPLIGRSPARFLGCGGRGEQGGSSGGLGSTRGGL
jgi:hypothetical protein